MLVENLIAGQIVKVIDGKSAGHAAQVRKVDPIKNTVTVMIMGKVKTLPASCVEPESE